MTRARKTNKDLPRHMLFKHGAYYYKINNKWHFLSRDKREALRAYADLLGDPTKLVTMNDLFKRYEIEVAAVELEASTIKNVQRSLRNLKLFFGKQRPQDIIPSDIYLYMDKRATTPIDEKHKPSKAWANKDRSVLKSVLDCAIRWGLVQTNACREVKQFALKARDRLITPQEFDAVKALASPLIRDAMDFAFLTKARRSEILRVRLEDLTDDGVILHRTKTKTSRTLLVTWSPALRSVVAKAKAHRRIGSFYLFCTEMGKKYTSNGFSSIWQRTMDKAVESGIERFHFHDIRAMAVTNTVDKHGLQAASEGAGHASTKITDRVYYRGTKKVKPTE